jgi:hypothetical protein
MEDVNESDLYIENLVDEDNNNNFHLKQLTVKSEEIFPEGALENAGAEDESVSEATGNEGATMERWYRRAAFVIWPRYFFLSLK